MSDPRNILQDKFKEQHRYTNFGSVIMRMHIKGFRCHSDTVIEISSPITAFCGFNGTGKSTLLQLAANAYKRPDASSPQYYIKDFMVVGTLDPAPFSDSATMEFQIWQEDRSLKRLRFSRDARNKKWLGYRSRYIGKKVFFASIGLYLPKVERRDFTVRNASSIVVMESSEVPANVKMWSCKVLSHNYENIYSNVVTHVESKGKVISVCRTGIRYSEPHMGFGEARSQYLINALESLPDKSLVLIEEPETSLHPSAQYQFGCYLVDVAIRKCHQIFLTTHSEFILQALPSASRVYLHKTAGGIEAIPGLTAQQAKSLMADGIVKALYVLVEDECTISILTEIIRRIDPIFLRSIGICKVGDADTLGRTVRTLKNTGLPVVGVLDADKTGSPAENIFKLPGAETPEKELFSNESVKEYMQINYGVNLDDFKAGLPGIDHHGWFERLAIHVSQDEAALIREISRVYAKSLIENEVNSLVTLLKESVRR
jgi:predicted ATPase